MTVDRYDGTNFLWDPKGGSDNTTPITPAKGIRFLQINGTDDQIVPYEGGKGTLGIEFFQLRTLSITGQYIWEKRGRN